MSMLGKFRGLWRRSREDDIRPRLYVAAFGKHPGWDDHMEDLGVDSDHLVDLKNAIYWDGIKGNLDAGAWTRELEAGQRLPGFDHLFLWSSVHATDLGHIWASRDGKSRSDYPMIACLSAERADPAWFMPHAAGILDRLHDACVAASTAGEVRAAVDDARADFRATEPPAESHAGGADRAALRTLAGLEPFASDPEQLVRLLYHLEREFGAGERSSTSTRSLHPEPVHLRVPACGLGAAESLAIWARLLQEETQALPVFVCRHRRADWVDAVVGVPGATEFFPLLALDSKIPPITSIPYEIDEEARARLRAAVDPD